jgi:pimeloyl-ACP methyl ester carboxylesterase
MHKAIPRSTLHIIKSAGHLTSLEQPEQVNEALRTLCTHCDAK